MWPIQGRTLDSQALCTSCTLDTLIEYDNRLFVALIICYITSCNWSFRLPRFIPLSRRPPNTDPVYEPPESTSGGPIARDRQGTNISAARFFWSTDRDS